MSIMGLNAKRVGGSGGAGEGKANSNNCDFKKMFHGSSLLMGWFKNRLLCGVEEMMGQVEIRKKSTSHSGEFH